MKNKLLSLVALLFLTLVVLPMCIKTESEPVAISVIQESPEEYVECLKDTYQTTKIFLIDDQDDSKIGRARLVKLSDYHYYLDLLFIEERYRSQQYGSQLFKLVSAYLQGQGARVMSWIASPVDIKEPSERGKKLPALVRFYEQCGSDTAVIHPDYNNPWVCMFYCLQSCSDRTKQWYKQQLTDWWINGVWPETM
jgi:hypothetical protein